MICEKCGSKIDENDSFCPKCGNIIDKKADINTNEQNNNLNIFNNQIKQNNDPEEKLIEKYKSNIIFFKLSDEQKNDNLLINEPIFPKSFFEPNKGETTNEQIETTNETIEQANITSIDNLTNDYQLEYINTETNQTIDNNTNPIDNQNYEQVTFDSNNNFQPETSQNTNIDPIMPNNLINNTTPETNIKDNLNIQTDNTESTQETNQANSNTNEIKPKKDKNNNLIVFVAIAFIALIVIAVIIINGNEKTLTCSLNTTEDNLTTKNLITTIFKDDKIQSMTIKGTETINKKEYVDLYFDYKTEQLNKYTQITGIKVTTNKKGNVINYSIVAEKNNSTQLFEEEFGKIEITAENFTIAAESQGYKCTAK